MTAIELMLAVEYLQEALAEFKEELSVMAMDEKLAGYPAEEKPETD